jgi:uncharacterized protein YkwD
MGRRSAWRAFALVAACLLPAAPAAAVPKVLGVEFEAAPEVGKSSMVAVSAQDPNNALTGVRVRFGAGEDDFAESACRARPRSASAAAAGTTKEFRVRHRYATPNARTVTVTIFSGTCTTRGATATYAFKVVPTGNPLAPLKIGGTTALRSVQTTPCGPDANLVPDAGNLARIQSATECLVSAERVRRGLGAVRPAPALRRAGDIQVADMLRHTYFAHERDGGPKLEERLRIAGYDFELAGENLGAGTGQYATPSEVVEQWIASPPHFENIVDPTFTEIGLGISTGFPMNGGSPNGATYALEFAVPAEPLTAAQIAAAKRAAAKKRALRKKCRKKAYRRAHAKACRAARR